MSILLAWVDSGDTSFLPAFARSDENVFAFEVAQDEGDFAHLTIEIKNPRVGLLVSSRKQWAWLSWQDEASTVHPLFFGRVVGVPDGQEDELLRLTLVARPADYEAQKEAVAAALRVLPWFDPVWLAADRRGDPDAVLESRSAFWHVDRTSHAVSSSDILEGEAGPLALGGNFMRDSLHVSYVQASRHTVRIRAVMAWDQTAAGVVDITRTIADAAVVAGTARKNVISSYTGGGLMGDWPQPGEDIGGGWSVHDTFLRRMDGTYITSNGKVASTTLYSQIYVPLWTISPVTRLGYDLSRRRTETVEIVVSAGIQPAAVDAASPDEILLEIGSTAAAEGIDGDIPIGALHRRSFFQTDRGRQALENLVLRARAILRAQARMVELVCEVDFATAIQATCRHAVSLSDPRLPGGSAIGKIAGYRFGYSSENGEMSGEIRIGAAIGSGGSVSADAAVPGYVVADYAAEGWQSNTGGTDVLTSGDVALGYYGGVEVVDDGMLLDQLDAAQSVLSCVVVNGETSQAAILDQPHEDAAAVISAMDAAATKVQLDMRPLNWLNFQTDFAPAVSALVIPKQIDLGAA